ncbi:MAG: DUF3794 domain-containing protein [Eubacteriales bacterium]|jgi:hypothetical protein
MDIKLQTSKLCCKEKIMDQTAEHVTEADVIVPDVLPDAARIVDVFHCVTVREETAETDAVTLHCDIVHTILYAPENGKGVRSIVCRGSFRHSFSARGVTADTQLWSQAWMHKCDCHLLNTRKIGLQCTIMLRVRGYADREWQLPCGLECEEGETETLCRPLDLYVTRGIGCRTFDVEDQLELPAGKGSIAELMDTRVELRHRESKVLRGKAVVKGEAQVALLYLSNAELGEVQCMEYTIPFSQIIDLPALQEGDSIQVGLELRRQEAEVFADESGQKRVVRLALEVRGTVIARGQWQGQVVEDAYSTRRQLQLRWGEMPAQRLVEETETQLTLKDVLHPPVSEGDNGCIIRICGRAWAGSTVVEEGRLRLTGTAEIDALYRSGGEEGEYHAIRKALPISWELPVEGEADRVECDPQVWVQSISYNINMSGELELRVVCGVRLRAVAREPRALLCGAEGGDAWEKGNRPSAIIYYKKPEEEIWSIAKQYAVRLEELADVNGVEEAGALAHAKMLLIP